MSRSDGIDLVLDNREWPRVVSIKISASDGSLEWLGWVVADEDGNPLSKSYADRADAEAALARINAVTKLH